MNSSFDLFMNKLPEDDRRRLAENVAKNQEDLICKYITNEMLIECIKPIFDHRTWNKLHQ